MMQTQKMDFIIDNERKAYLVCPKCGHRVDLAVTPNTIPIPEMFDPCPICGSEEDDD